MILRVRSEAFFQNLMNNRRIGGSKYDLFQRLGDLTRRQYSGTPVRPPFPCAAGAGGAAGLRLGGADTERGLVRGHSPEPHGGGRGLRADGKASGAVGLVQLAAGGNAPHRRRDRTAQQCDQRFCGGKSDGRRMARLARRVHPLGVQRPGDEWSSAHPR